MKAVFGGQFLRLSSLTKPLTKRGRSQTWLEDFATSDVEGRELTCGLFRMNAGEALQYTYT